MLSEPEEKILAEKAVTGASAWSRLFDELTSSIEVRLPPIPGRGENGGEAAAGPAGAETATVSRDEIVEVQTGS